MKKMLSLFFLPEFQNYLFWGRCWITEDRSRPQVQYPGYSASIKPRCLRSLAVRLQAKAEAKTVGKVTREL